MPFHPHAQEQVAGRTAAAARPALSGQADPLPGAHAVRDVDLEVAPIPERQPLLAAGGGFLERELERRLLVGAAKREAVGAGAPTATAGASALTAEEALEEVAEVATAEVDAHVAENRSPPRNASS